MYVLCMFFDEMKKLINSLFIQNHLIQICLFDHEQRQKFGRNLNKIL